MPGRSFWLDMVILLIMYSINKYIHEAAQLWFFRVVEAVRVILTMDINVVSLQLRDNSSYKWH